MKIIRKPPEAPVESPKAEGVGIAPQAPFDTEAMVKAIEALHAAAERIQAPSVQVSVPEIKIPAAEKPKAFTVTITKRDHKGRAVEFDVKVKEEEPDETDPFVSGYHGVKQ